MVDILKLAEQFSEAVSGMPPEHDLKHLHQLDKEDIDQLIGWGTAPEVVGNPPKWAADPKIWARAKKAIKPYWSKYKQPYKVVADLYLGNFKGRIKKKKKSYLQLFLIRYAAELNLQNMTAYDAAHILGVSMPITAEALKKAYKQKVVEHHPDRNPGKDTSDELKKISRAFEILSKAVSKAHAHPGRADETDFENRIRVRDKTNSGKHHRGFNFGKYSLSIQASYAHYCNPREDLPSLADYDELEIAIVDNTTHKLVKFYSTYGVRNPQLPDDLKDMPGIKHFSTELSVGSYVPKEVVKQIFEFMRNKFGLISEL